jgi:Alcohol dehydrogenase GroES-like domain
MKAARYYGPGDIRIDDVPEPRTRPGTVKVEVEWCGICGTDLHEYSGSGLLSQVSALSCRSDQNAAEGSSAQAAEDDLGQQPGSREELSREREQIRSRPS